MRKERSVKMKNYRIYPVCTGRDFWPKTYLLGGAFSSPTVEIPHMVFVIQGEGRNILVDTGGGEPGSEAMVKYHSPTYARKPEERPDIAIKAATGLSPDDFEIVILTHLHWDHAGNCGMFPQAEFYVQFSEVVDSINPIPRFAKTFESFSVGAVPPWAQQPLKWHFLNGDAEIVPGISVVLMPGHSKGIQGVMVETVAGKYFLGSDSIPLYDCVTPDGKTVPAALNYSLEDAHYSSLKVNSLDYTAILPGHDAKVLEHKCYPI